MPPAPSSMCMQSPLPCAVDTEPDQQPHQLATSKTALRLARHALVCSARLQLPTRARVLGGQAREVKKSAYLNLAAVHLKTDAWHEARDACNKARPPRAREQRPRLANLRASRSSPPTCVLQAVHRGAWALCLVLRPCLAVCARPCRLLSTLAGHCTHSACPVARAWQGLWRGRTTVAGGGG